MKRARRRLKSDLDAAQLELDELCRKVIEAGLGTWSGDVEDQKNLIVRGHAHLLSDVSAQTDLERIRPAVC